MAEIKNVPAIRFKGFDYEWSGKALDEIGELKNGMNFPKSAMGHGYPFVNLQDVFGRNIVNDTNLGLAVSNENQRKEYGLQKGDVLFIRSSVKPEGVGEAALVKNTLNNTTYSGFIIRFRASTEMDDNFKRFVFSIAGVRKQILSNATSSANTNINQDSLKKLRLKLPIVDEQTQIGSYFQHHDKLINLHQAKVNKLTNLKKAMLEKMFPKAGENVPEIRFKGFAGAWEVKELGDVVKITMGQSPNGINYTNNPDDHILVQGNADMKNGKVVPRVWTREVTKSAQAGDLIMSVRAPVGEIGKTSFNVVIGRGVAAIKGNEFIFQSLKKMNDDGYWKRFSAGSTFDSINSSELSKAVIFVTVIDEQEKIGTYFQNLDKTITLHQTMLEKLNNLKKACLEKMFV